MNNQEPAEVKSKKHINLPEVSYNAPVVLTFAIISLSTAVRR